MSNWLDGVFRIAPGPVPAVLITVAIAEGSSPREPGAKMLVTSDAQFDTIGGGHLELRACEIAREMLRLPPGPLPDAAASSLLQERRLVRFPLGPSLGQCCGGVVQLAFERIDRCHPDFLAALGNRWQDRQDSWRIVPLDTALHPVLTDRDGTILAGPPESVLPEIDPDRPCHVTADPAGHRWLIDPVCAYRPHLVLFGAGHVGSAIVRTLADLPCHVTWVDERDDIFPDEVPSNVTIEVTDTPEAIVDTAGAGTTFLVLTHSHALDQRLAESILRRPDAGWFGLIGSKTKRMQFEHRLLERGIAQERLAAMVCPIGIPGITGKAPAVVAASVCAQLLQVWEAQQQAAASIAHSLHAA